MRTYRPRTGPNPQNRISNFDKNLQEKGIRYLSLKTSISENRHGAQISEVLPHFGEEKAPQPLVRGIAVDTVRPDERGREDRALLGASENAEVRRAAERVRGLKRNASRVLRAEEEGHRDEVGGRENRQGLSRRIEALDHGNEAAVVGRGLGKRDLRTDCRALTSRSVSTCPERTRRASSDVPRAT